MATLESQNIFLRPYLVYQPIWGWDDFGSFQLPQSNCSPGAWNLGGLYLAPHEDNSIKLLSTANNYKGLPYLFSSVWRAFSETWCHWGMDVFYSDSKTDLKLRCDHCINFQLFDVTQDIFSRSTVVCCTLLQHSPYRLPQQKGHVCGPFSSCKHRICGYLRFLSIRVVSIMWVQHVADSLSGQQSVTFIGQCWYFNTVNSSGSDKQTEQCLDCICQLGQIAQLLCVVI